MYNINVIFFMKQDENKEISMNIVTTGFGRLVFFFLQCSVMYAHDTHHPVAIDCRLCGKFVKQMAKHD